MVHLRPVCQFIVASLLLKPLLRRPLSHIVPTIMTTSYPRARRDDTVVDDYHGTKIYDPYRWLEDPDATETKDYVEALNKVSLPFLNSCTLKDKINKRLTELWNYPKYGCPKREGDHYFYSYNTGLQNQNVIFIQDSLTSDAKVFLDPNTLSSDGTTSLSATAYNDAGDMLAYGLSEKGSDWMSVQFKRIPSGEELPDKLTKLRYSSLTWTKDGSGVFYNMFPGHRNDAEGTRTDKNEFHSLYYHRLGTEQSEDLLVYDCPDNPAEMIGAEVTDAGEYLILDVSKGCDPMNLLYYYDLTNGIAGKLNAVPIIDKYEAKYEFICNDGPLFYVMTNLNAPMFKLVQIDIRKPTKENWKVILEEKATSKLDWVGEVDGSKLVVCYMEDVKDKLHVYDKTGAHLYQLPLNIGSVSGFSGKKKFSEIFYSFSSFLTPGIIYHCDLKESNPTPKVFRSISVKGFDASQFETNQYFFESKDGTKVPIFVIHKKGIEKDGKNPTLLYGYGGFNIALSPSFSISRLMFMSNFGGIYALANIRGGSEYGEKWHEGGMLERKQNVFDDFIAAAEYLQREKLAIQGGSNGGTLVGVCSAQRPDLFGAVLNQVGVLDMLRFQNFTIGNAWVPEFGTSAKPDDFKWLIKYSPLHNLRTPDASWQYPATLLATADHDDRVVPLHSLKYMAELYHMVKDSQHQTKPLLIRVETKAGHGAGKPTAKIIEELTDVYSFLVKVLGLEWIDTK